jgi:hypothetical protein
MVIPETIYTDPRFLEVARMLRERKIVEEPPPPGVEAPNDEATRRVQAKINLRMKQRKTKEKP